MGGCVWGALAALALLTPAQGALACDCLWPVHHSTDKLPFVTMGSGSLAAMAVFEAGYKDDLSVRGAGGGATEVSAC